MGGRKQTDAQRLQRSIDNFINERVEQRVEEIRRNFARNNATSYRRYSADSDGELLDTSLEDNRLPPMRRTEADEYDDEMMSRIQRFNEELYGPELYDSDLD